MTVRAMRTIDRIVGVPLCILVGWFAQVRARFALKRKNPSPAVVLINKFFGLGSILLVTPLIHALKKNYPRSKVVFLTFDGNRELLQRFSHIDVILTIRSSGIAPFVLDTVKALMRLRRLRVDVSLDLEFFSKFSTLVQYVCGSRVRVGFELPTRWRRWLLTDQIPIDRTKHVSELFLSQLRVLGISTSKVHPPSILVSDADVEEACRCLGLDHIRDRIVCVNVNAGEASLDRRWHKTNFATLIHRLANAFPGVTFLFTGTPEEKSYVEEVFTLMPMQNSHVRNVAGMTSLSGFFALLSRSTLLITNDSGPLHLASSVGVPTISMFGPESPEFYGPLSGTNILFYEKTMCSPCLNIYQAKQFACPFDRRCLERINVADVFHAARSILADDAVKRAVA